MNQTIDRIVKVTMMGIAAATLAAGVNSCITYRQNPNNPSQKQYRYGEEGSWSNCECNSDADCSEPEPYCNGCFCVECRTSRDCGINEKCSNGSCEEKKDYSERYLDK